MDDCIPTDYEKWVAGVFFFSFGAPPIIYLPFELELTFVTYMEWVHGKIKIQDKVILTLLWNVFFLD